MGKTYRKDTGRGTQKNEPYQKKAKNENLGNYKGYSSNDFDDDEDEFEWFDEFREDD